MEKIGQIKYSWNFGQGHVIIGIAGGKIWQNTKLKIHQFHQLFPLSKIVFYGIQAQEKVWKIG